MTSEEKAKEILSSFYLIKHEKDFGVKHAKSIAKRSALIHVNNIINMFKRDVKLNGSQRMELVSYYESVLSHIEP